MSTFLFVTVDAGGNVPPVIAIGRELVRRGHRVRVLGHERQRTVFEFDGFDFTAFERMPRWEPTLQKSVPRTISDLVGLSTHRGIGQDLDRLLDSHPVDLVVVDCMMLSALSAATRSGVAVPCVVLMHTFSAFWDGLWVRGPVGIAARLRGLNARQLWAAADLELVVSDRQLDPAGQGTQPHRVWSGVLERGVRREIPTDSRPRVLVSLSTTSMPGQHAALRRILIALGSLPLNAIVTTGPAIDPATLTAPANVELLALGSHRQIMPTVSAVIGHGGHSTTMLALAHDLPLVLMPMHPLIDQPMVARAVTDAGAGITLGKKASPAMIAGALMRVLGTESYARRAAELGLRLRAGDGAAVAADRLIVASEQVSQ
jgi:UDP:flavonoid glycosyltransferase YjiC (YdhE family)